MHDQILEGTMQINWALLADSANATADGKLNLLGVFDQVNAPNVPCQHPLASIVLQFALQPGDYGVEYPIELVLLDPDAIEVVRETATITFAQPSAGGSSSSGLIRNIQWLIFPKYGEYEIHVWLNGEDRHTVPIAVRRSKAP